MTLSRCITMRHVPRSSRNGPRLSSAGRGSSRRSLSLSLSIVHMTAKLSELTRVEVLKVGSRLEIVHRPATSGASQTHRRSVSPHRSNVLPDSGSSSSSRARPAACARERDERTAVLTPRWFESARSCPAAAALPTCPEPALHRTVPQSVHGRNDKSA